MRMIISSKYIGTIYGKEFYNNADSSVVERCRERKGGCAWVNKL